MPPFQTLILSAFDMSLQRNASSGTVALCIFWPIGLFFMGWWGALIVIIVLGLIGAYDLGSVVIVLYGIISIFSLVSARSKVSLKNEQTETNYKNELNKYNDELSKYSKRVTSEKKRMLRESKEKDFRINRIYHIDSHINSSQLLLFERYKKSVLHPKYQHLVAAASIVDYLSTQRTYSLTLNGNDIGAYNIYEDDVRFNRIVAAQLCGANQIVNAVKQANASIRQMQQTLYNTVVIESKNIQDTLLNGMDKYNERD